MRIAIVLTICAAAVVIAAQPVALPRAAPESVGLDPHRLKEATALLNRFVIDRKIAGAVAAVAAMVRPPIEISPRLQNRPSTVHAGRTAGAEPEPLHVSPQRAAHCAFAVKT